jgi:hypothetical protein
VPVLPGAEGFGTTTAAGRGGQVLVVTSLADSGPGTLRAAVETLGPRTVLFAIGGVIELQKEIVVTAPNLTIAGQTAPGPGITLIGAGLLIEASDVLVQHLRIRVGDRDQGPPFAVRDGLRISMAKNVVIDHCSISWAVDENVDVWEDVSDVTFRHCLISEGLASPKHPKGPHSMGMRIGPNAQRIFVDRCVFAHNHRRNPVLANDTSVVLRNCVIYNPGTEAIGVGTAGAGPVHLTVLGTVMLAGPNTRARPVPEPLLRVEPTASPGTKVFLLGNARPELGGDWKGAVVAPGAPADVPAALPPLMLPGLIAAPTGEVLAPVLAAAGARPTKRDAIDNRVIQTIRTKTGKTIASQAEVGGFPAYDPVTATLTPPSSTADTNGNGYTDLEEWLFTLP